MPAITFGGLASGLPPNLVDQLIEAEKIPIKNIEIKKEKSESRLKLVNDLEAKVVAFRDSLNELAGTKSFNDMKLESGDPNIIAGVVDPSKASTGSWNLEVLELPQKAAAITNGFPDKDKTSIGVGYFRFETPDGDKDVYIKAGSNSLDGAAAAINSADVGVKASVLKDGKDEDRPYKLMLTGNDVGKEFKVNYPTLYFLDGEQDIYFDGSREAKNGKIKVDGFEIEVYDNKVNDIVPGVTLDLRQAAPGRNVNLTVTENLEVVSGKIKTFVDAANGVLGFIQSQNKIDAGSDTSKTLGGDTLLRTIEQRMRRLILNPQVGTGRLNRLNQIGIEFNRNGTLNFSQDKFNKALAENPDAVRQFFAGDGFATGFIPSVKRDVGALLDSGFGMLANRKRGLTQQLRQMDDRIAQKERAIGRKETQLREKFARMEETVSRMKSQGNAVGAMGGGGSLAGLAG